MARKQIGSHTDLTVYQLAFDLAMQIFELTKAFPKEERYALTDQIRRSSRSVCAQLAEAWRKRQYRNAFVSKLNDATAELAETQTWLQFAAACQFLELPLSTELSERYEGLSRAIVTMILHADDWLLPPP
jgi:four helix bundle protein